MRAGATAGVARRGGSARGGRVTAGATSRIWRGGSATQTNHGTGSPPTLMRVRPAPVVLEPLEGLLSAFLRALVGDYGEDDSLALGVGAVASVHLSARGASCSAARALCVWLCGRSPSRGAHSAAACGAALALLAPARSCRRVRGGVALGRRSSVAAARSIGARGASCSAARALCVWLWGRSPSRVAHGAAACGAAPALLAPARSCRRARGGVTLGRRSFTAAARSLSARGASCSAARALCVWLWGRSPSRVAHGAAACGAALALLAPARSCRRARGGVTLGRRSSAAAARSLARALGPYGAGRRRLALSACGQWRGRFLSGGGRRRAALTAPLPAALRWRSWRRLGRAAAPAAA